jgi:hypothetical protein
VLAVRTVRYEDLPAAARAQVDAQLGRKGKRKRDTTVIGGPCDYACHACDEPFDTFEKAERHSHATGHVRQDMVLR